MLLCFPGNPYIGLCVCKPLSNASSAYTHMQLHTNLHTERKAPPQTTLLRVSGWQTLASSFFFFFLIWAVFPKLFLFFFKFYFTFLPAAWLASHFPYIHKKGPPGSQQLSSNRGRFCWGIALQMTYIQLSAYSSSPPPQCVTSTSPTNVASDPGVAPASPPQGQFLPLFWVCVLTWAEANPDTPPPDHSCSPVCIANINATQPSFQEVAQLTCGGKMEPNKSRKVTDR